MPIIVVAGSETLFVCLCIEKISTRIALLLHSKCFFFSSFTSSFSESLISFFPFFSSCIFCFFSLCSYLFFTSFSSFSFASLYSFTFILFFHCPLSFSYLTTPLISFSFLLFSSCLCLLFTVYSNLFVHYFSFFPSPSSFLPLSLSAVPVQCIPFTLFKIFYLPFSCLLPKQNLKKHLLLYVKEAFLFTVT